MGGAFTSPLFIAGPFCVLPASGVCRVTCRRSLLTSWSCKSCCGVLPLQPVISCFVSRSAGQEGPSRGPPAPPRSWGSAPRPRLGYGPRLGYLFPTSLRSGRKQIESRGECSVQDAGEVGNPRGLGDKRQCPHKVKGMTWVGGWRNYRTA